MENENVEVGVKTGDLVSYCEGPNQPCLSATVINIQGSGGSPSATLRVVIKGEALTKTSVPYGPKAEGPSWSKNPPDKVVKEAAKPKPEPHKPEPGFKPTHKPEPKS